MKKQQKTIGLSSEIKEALAEIAGSKYFPVFSQFLKNQLNNIALEEWFRVKPSDPNIREKKAFYEGRFQEIKVLIKVFEDAKKERK
jgi:hypothetical protein